MFGSDGKFCERWRGDRVALYPISFENDLSRENVFVMFLKRSLYFSEHVVVNFTTFLFRILKVSQRQTEFQSHELYD